MKNTFIPLLVVGTALMATGCDQQGASGTGLTSSAPTVSKADAIASVNGIYISKDTLAKLEQEIALRSQGQTFPKDRLVNELVQSELLVQDALQKKLDKTPEVQELLERTRRQVLAQAGIQNLMKTNPVTDAEIKAEYDSKMGGDNAKEYKARHILVKPDDKELAVKIIGELDKGGDFAKLANKHSLDGKEAQNGGELGWFSAGQMVEPFSKAVIALEKGKYSKEPVQTQFGWHIILKEDERAQKAPPLEDVKPQLKPFLERKKVQDIMENMRKQAKVEILIPLTDEQPAVVEEVTKAKPIEKAPATDKAAPAEKSEKADHAEEAGHGDKAEATKTPEAHDKADAKPAHGKD